MTERQNSMESIIGLVDRDSPFGEPLRGIYKRGGAYRSLKDRLPVILTKIIDGLSREKEEIVEKYGKSSSEDLKQVIGRISKLKNELVTNKPFLPLVYSTHQNETNSDIVTWNDYLVERSQVEGRVPAWYNTFELYSECYLYRRIMEAFYLTDTLYTYDPFSKLKKESLYESLTSIIPVATHTLDLINRAKDISSAERKRGFAKLLRVGLWGNRCDLSLSAGVANGQVGDPLELLDSLEEDILIDDTEIVWDVLAKAGSSNKPVTVDIILDNSGYEFFTDLTLAAFLIAHNFAQKIRFYVKSIPWFISDVTNEDFNWVIESLIDNSNPELAEFGKLLKNHLKTGAITIEEHQFWTYPFTFTEMGERDPALYAKLSEASLLIIKGDLNYRKLVCDVNWEYTTSITHGIQEFFPTNFVALRSIKSDVITGLNPQQGQTLNKIDPRWMFTGQYGVIQTCIDV